MSTYVGAVRSLGLLPDACSRGGTCAVRGLCCTQKGAASATAGLPTGHSPAPGRHTRMSVQHQGRVVAMQAAGKTEWVTARSSAADRGSHIQIAPRSRRQQAFTGLQPHSGGGCGACTVPTVLHRLQKCQGKRYRVHRRGVEAAAGTRRRGVPRRALLPVRRHKALGISSGARRHGTRARLRRRSLHSRCSCEWEHGRHSRTAFSTS